MAKEVEKKFLVTNDSWRKDVIESFDITQGYILYGELLHARVRIIEGKKVKTAYLTIKSNEQLIRDEYEYVIPMKDAKEMMAYATDIVKKTRHIIPEKKLKWEIDEFDNGVVVAEIELINGEEGPVIRPWLGKDVTRDEKYYNVNIARMK